MSDDYADRLADLVSDGLSSEQARTCAGKGIPVRVLMPDGWQCEDCGQWNFIIDPECVFCEVAPDAPPAAPPRPSTRPEAKTSPVPHPEGQDDS